MNVNDFNVCLEKGLHAEEEFKRRIAFVLLAKLFHFNWELNMVEQKDGSDLSIGLDPIKIDVKARDYKFHRLQDFFIEIYSVLELKTLGWIHTSKADFIAYFWWNKEETEFIDGYFLHLPSLRYFLYMDVPYKLQERVAASGRNGNSWHTKGLILPVSIVPSNCMVHINISELYQTSSPGYVFIAPLEYEAPT